MLAARQKVVEYLLALGITDALQNHLLGSLCADATHFKARQRLFNEIADFGIGLFLDRFVQLVLARGCLDFDVWHHFPAAEKRKLTRITVHRGTDIHVFTEFLFAGGSQGEFERAENDFFFDVFLARQRIHQQ